MTARQVFEGMLIELSKVNAPSLLLLDFNYFFNKAINLYINKQYNIYDINQLTTDDIRVLKSTAILDPKKSETAYEAVLNGGGVNSLFGATYEVNLPKDYLHILNCICVYKVKKQFKCYDSNSYIQFAAKRLTSDSWGLVINDYFNRPLPERPYYFIHNVNTSDNGALPTDPGQTDLLKSYKVTPFKSLEDLVNELDTSNFPRAIDLGGLNTDTNNHLANLVEKGIGVRVGNPSNVRMEIRYGKDDSVFSLEKVLVDYVKVPQYIRLTQEQLDLTEDTSQIMEFPDYVCQEIINELVHIVMENTADPRLLTHIPVSQSIANPAQALAQPQAQQLA